MTSGRNRTSGLASWEASRFALPDGWQGSRRELRGVTIDEERTQDRDDALWLERVADGFRLFVSISDVGTFLDPSSAMAKQAEERGESRYGRTGTIPMLPLPVSEGALSLLEAKETPVLCVALTLDLSGEVTAVEFIRGRIRPHRLTHRDIDASAVTPGRPGATDVLRQYEGFAMVLLERRREEGAFAVYDPAAGVMTDGEGRLLRLAKGRSYAGKLIVQEFSILANTAVAEYLCRREIPALYRNHALALDVSEERAIEILLSGSPEQTEVLRQGFGRARYGTEPTGHAGLSLAAYAQWTSPLRRFADFVNHQNLTAHLDGRELPYREDRLGEIAAHLNDVEDDRRGRKATYLKAVTRAAGARRLAGTAEQLLACGSEELFGTIRYAASAGVAPLDFSTAVLQRLTERALGPRELMALLFGARTGDDSWDAITAAVLGHLRANPPDAVSVLSCAEQAGFVRSPSLEVVPAGSGFYCRASVEVAEGGRADAEASGRSKTQAKQAAAVKLLLALAGAGDAGPFPESAGDSGGRASDALPANPKGMLQECLQRSGGGLPHYETTELGSGPSHGFTTTLSLTWAGEALDFPGIGATKRASEAEAAAQAIRTLDLIGWKPPETSQAVRGDDYISALQEWCQGAGRALPSYRFTSSVGPAHEPRFRCVVSVIGDDDAPLEFDASAGSKQRAKAAAAEAAFHVVALGGTGASPAAALPTWMPTRLLDTAHDASRPLITPPCQNLGWCSIFGHAHAPVMTAPRPLQNLHHRFDSGRRLQKLPCIWSFSVVRACARNIGFGKTADILPTRLGGIVENVCPRGTTERQLCLSARECRLCAPSPAWGDQVAFTELDLRRIDRIVGGFCRCCTGPELADQLRLVCEISGQSVIISEERPDLPRRLRELPARCGCDETD